MTKKHNAAVFMTVGVLALGACGTDVSEPAKSLTPEGEILIQGGAPSPLVPDQPRGLRAHQFKDIKPTSTALPREQRLRARGPAKILTPRELEEIRNEPTPEPPAEDDTSDLE